MLFLPASLPFSKDDSTQWVVLAVGVLATLYLIMRGKGKRRRDPMERQAMPSLSQQRQVERDISSLMVEMLDTARQMTAQLDTRAARLELLMKEADAKLAALKAASIAPAASTLPPRSPPAAVLAPPDPVPAPAEDAPPRVETPPDPRHAEVYDLADQGRSPHEIARHLNRPNGEVELILALRPH
jgi:DNA-binding NarL/FixJ family response regulator